jgi:hypothetical protein
MKCLILSLVVILGLTLVAAPASGGGINLSGPHYNLNIIGVDNPKTQPLTGGDRHTIFLALTGKSNIWLTQGPFAVCDGNSFDQAFDCSGLPLGNKIGSVFQLPCDTSVPTDTGCTGFSQDYTVWIRALGAPGGKASITLCATDDLGNLICNTGANVVSLTSHGKRTFTNVTKQLTTLQDVCFDAGGSIVCEDVSLFDPELVDFAWQYDNNGLRLAQLRFYVQ